MVGITVANRRFREGGVGRRHGLRSFRLNFHPFYLSSIFCISHSRTGLPGAENIRLRTVITTDAGPTEIEFSRWLQGPGVRARIRSKGQFKSRSSRLMLNLRTKLIRFDWFLFSSVCHQLQNAPMTSLLLICFPFMFEVRDQFQGKEDPERLGK
jgi:hypothetical protein